MLRRISILFLIALISTPVFATSIERDPTRRNGAGPLFQIRRGKLWGYMDGSSLA